MSSKVQFVGVLAVCVFALSLTGCRNRCQQPCGGVPYQQPFQQGFYGYNAQGYNPQAFNPQALTPQAFGAQGIASTSGVAARSPIIAPPATGSLNIPSLARNNPFGVNRNTGLINTGQAAPTPAANRSARFNQQNGWQPVDGSARPTNNPSNSGQSSSGTTLGRNSGSDSRSVVPTGASSVLVQDTQSRSNQSYGNSYVRSPNYSTTAVNETFDSTRLPATDASGVRAPSQYYARASGAQVAQIPGQGIGIQQPNYYSATFQRPNNVAAGVIPTGVNPAGIVASRSSNLIVQDQGTATYDPYSNTRSADWRNRDVTSGTFQ